VAEDGYRSLTVDQLARRAGTSLRVLYDEYGGKQGCVLHAFEGIRDRALAATRAAYDNEAEWPEQMRAANRAILAHLAARPASAHFALVGVLGAGRAAVDLRDQLLAPFAELITRGRNRRRRHRGSPPRRARSPSTAPPHISSPGTAPKACLTSSRCSPTSSWRRSWSRRRPAGVRRRAAVRTVDRPRAPAAPGP
jgi:AcrR family transcriptional regulator